MKYISSLLIIVVSLGYSWAQVITPEQLQAKIENKEKLVIFDIRDTESYNKGTLAGAVHVNWDGLELEKGYQNKIPGSDFQIIIICENGQESANAVKFLKEENCPNPVFYVKGGFEACVNILHMTQFTNSTWGMIKSLFGSGEAYRPKVGYHGA